MAVIEKSPILKVSGLRRAAAASAAQAGVRCQVSVLVPYGLPARHVPTDQKWPRRDLKFRHKTQTLCHLNKETWLLIFNLKLLAGYMEIIKKEAPKAQGSESIDCRIRIADCGLRIFKNQK